LFLAQYRVVFYKNSCLDAFFSIKICITQIKKLLLRKSNNFMRTKEEYIALIKAHSEELKATYGIKSLRLFGSVSRNEQSVESDVDVCVDMAPKMFLVVRLKRFLENLLQCSVDVVRLHKHMNPFLLNEIERDGIYLIK